MLISVFTTHEQVDKNGPTRFKKDLLTYKNTGYKFMDRVIFIGCTRAPEKADPKDIKNFFDKHIYLPYPDYAARLMIWRALAGQQLDEAEPGRGALARSFDFSTLARITNGFSAGMRLSLPMLRLTNFHNLINFRGDP